MVVTLLSCDADFDLTAIIPAFTTSKRFSPAIVPLTSRRGGGDGARFRLSSFVQVLSKFMPDSNNRLRRNLFNKTTFAPIHSLKCRHQRSRRDNPCFILLPVHRASESHNPQFLPQKYSHIRPFVWGFKGGRMLKQT